ncbi:MAG: hypothetical protein QOK03_2495 [Candidatus Binataceae bacterium]|jgi:hypothetical protein|nr:hypothetical protein [Candidatus Binataceae bacterium]
MAYEQIISDKSAGVVTITLCCVTSESTRMSPTKDFSTGSPTHKEGEPQKGGTV